MSEQPQLKAKVFSQVIGITSYANTTLVGDVITVHKNQKIQGKID